MIERLTLNLLSSHVTSQATGAVEKLRIMRDCNIETIIERFNERNGRFECFKCRWCHAGVIYHSRALAHPR